MTDQIVITVTPLPEHCPVRGNALASGDAALDRKAEDAILARLDRDDLWGWCEVRVRATWTAPSGREWHGDAFLGCCSYDGEADWREPGGYHEQMAIEAIEALHEALRADVAEAAEAAEFLSTHPLRVSFDAPLDIRHTVPRLIARVAAAGRTGRNHPP